MEVGAQRQVESSPSTLIPVDVASLRPGVVDFDLHIQQGDAVHPVLFCRRSYPLQPEDIDRLSRRRIKSLYVGAIDHAAYRRQTFDRLSDDEQIPPSERYRIVCDISQAVFEAALKRGAVDDLLDLTTELGEQLTGTICHNDLFLADLFHLMKHDNNTYTHSVNVCTYSLILAKELGISKSSDLEAIAGGALLHDLGKRYIRSELLNKLGPLNETQRRCIRDHPTLGFQDLFLREGMVWGQLMMVYQHHERLDGTGYPVQIGGDEIHPWARICAVADIFHALTSQRPYRCPMSITDAAEYLRQQAKVALDKEMVRCWTASMTILECV